MKRQLLPLLATLGGLLAVFMIVLLFSTQPAAARAAEFALDESELASFDAGRRSSSEAPQSDVRAHGSEGSQGPELRLSNVRAAYPVASLSMYVNYAYDWVGGSGDVGATVAVTVTASDDSPKADAVVSADASGYFSVSCEDWSAAQCPDILPGDKVYAMANGVEAEVNPVGQITGRLDEVANTVDGTLLVPGVADDLDVMCQVWAEPGSDVITKTVAATGGTFSCDFSNEAGWDLQRGDMVALTYSESDGDLVTNIPPWPWVRVNYGHDWAGVNYEMGHTFWLTATDSGGSVKATAEIETTSGGGWGEPGYETVAEDWSPENPDFMPGDWVYFAADDGFTNTLHVGEISGNVDVGADTVTGIVVANGFGVSLTVECHPWGAWEEGLEAPVKDSWAEPDGSVPYSCAWDLATEWDVQPGQDIGIMYVEPDQDRVINVARAPAAYLQIEKWADSWAGEDGNIGFHIRYRNDGDIPAENVVITDTTQGGLSYLGDTSSFGHTGGGSGPIVINVGTVNPGVESFFDIFFEVTAPAGDQISNVAQIATSSADQGEPWEKESDWTGEVQANDTFLNVGKDAWTGDPAPGKDLIFTVNICNNGSTASSEVHLIDEVNPPLTIVNWWGNLPGWSEDYHDPGRLELSHPSLQGYGCSEVYVRANVDAEAQPGETISNTASIEAANDLSPDDNEAHWEGAVNQPHANFYIDKWLNWGQLVPGGELSYGVGYGNNGNVPAGPILITDTFPVSTTFAGAWYNDGFGGYDFPPLILTDEYAVWEVDGLENGFGGDFEVRLNVDAEALPGTLLVNEVEINSLPEEDSYEDNTSSWTEILNPAGPNLRVTKRHDWEGDWRLNYSLNFQNVGSETVADVWIDDVLPQGTSSDGGFDLQFDWERLLDGYYDGGSNTFQWNIDQLDPGESGWINYGADLDQPGEPLRWYTNTAEISIPPGDTNPDDNYFEDVAFSGAEAQRIEFWLNEEGSSGMWGEAVPGYPITVTTPYTQVYAWADPGCDGCWNIDDAGPILAGDVVVVEAGEAIMPAAITIPDPLEAQVDTEAGEVSGVIGGWSERPVEVHGNWAGGFQQVVSDPAGNFLAVYPAIPRGADGYIRFIDEVDYAEVIFHRPFLALDLILDVNYGHNWVDGAYEPGHTVWITVTESDKTTVKGLAELTSGFLPDWGSQSGFSTNWDGWIGQQPDMVPGDWVFGKVDNGFTSEVEIGEITGILDLDADTIEGQVFAPWDGMLDGRCGVWVQDGPGFEFMVNAAGGPYFCDFSSSWDLTPGQTVGVSYREPDGDWVGNAFESPVPYLRIEKWADDQPAEGGNLRLTIEYWNEGNGPAEDVTITDNMLGGMVYIDDTSGLPHVGSGSGPITWNAGLLEPGESHRFDVFVEVTAEASAVITNTALVETSNPWDQGEPWEKQSVWEGLVVENNTFLNVGKQAWTGDPAPGYNFVFAVNICNNGGTGSNEVIMTDSLGAGLSLVDWWSQQPGWYEIHNDPGQLVVGKASVSGFSCEEVYLETFLAAGIELGTLISNTALIESANDLSPDDNFAYWEGYASPVHTNLGLNKWFNWGLLVPGGEISYGINLFNNGNVPVGTVLLTDTLPAGTSFAGSWIQDEGGEQPFTPLEVADGYVVWEFPNVPNGYNFNFEVRVNIDEAVSPGTTLTNTVTVQPQPEEDSYEDNTAYRIDVINDYGPNLRVYKWGQWDDWGPDTRQAAYWIQIQNIGNVRVDGIVMTDTYPAEMDFSQGPDTEWWRLLDWWDDPGNHTLTAVFDYLDPGETTWFNFAAAVPGDEPLPSGQVFGNLVEVEPAPGEVELQDNVAEVFLTTGPDLFVEKELVEQGPLPGDLVTFSLSFGNNRPDNEWWWGLQAPAIMTDTLPDGLEYVEAWLLDCQPNGDPCPFDPLPGDGQTLVWELWELGAGHSGQVLLTTRISEDARNADVYRNSVEILSAEPGLDVETNYDNNQDYVDVTMALPEFEISKSYEGSLLPKSEITYTLRFSNVGDLTGTGLVITDRLPTNVTWISGGEYDGDSGVITWTVPSLAAGNTATVQFSGQLACSGQVVNDQYRVADSDQGITSPWGAALSFTIAAPTISADFSLSASIIKPGGMVVFTSTSTTDGPPLTVFGWDFDDGQTGSGDAISHVFSAAGEYDVELTAADSCGYQNTTSHTVQVKYMTLLPFLTKQ